MGIVGSVNIMNNNQEKLLNFFFVLVTGKPWTVLYSDGIYQIKDLWECPAAVEWLQLLLRRAPKPLLKAGVVDEID